MLKLAFLLQYLLEKMTKFDQTYTETLLGELELIRFWLPSLCCSDVISSEQMHGFRPNLHKNIVGGDLELIRFW